MKALSVALYSEGVMSNDRIAAFLNAAGNEELALSDGSIYHFCKVFPKKRRRASRIRRKNCWLKKWLQLMQR